jgi:hypothetical protein
MLGIKKKKVSTKKEEMTVSETVFDKAWADIRILFPVMTYDFRHHYEFRRKEEVSTREEQ